MTTGDESGRHYSTRSPDREWDAVVIGSGMGGMATAALLSKLGRKVLVLEQHYVPGGFTHTFKRKRWVWDVGVHAVGEVTRRALLGRVLSELTNERLEWASLGDHYDEFYYPDLRIDFPNQREAFIAAVEDAFPSERDALRAYFDEIRDTARTMRSYYLARLFPAIPGDPIDRFVAGRAQTQLLRRTGDVLDGISSNDRFKTVLTAQWGYYGSPRARSSWGIHAMVARHFFHGAYYPVGGAEQIAEHLLGTVAEAGGWTRIRADVREIVIESGRATGVRLASGETIRAKAVVSAAGAQTTVRSLLPEHEREKAWARSIRDLKQSPAHVCLYLGFKGDIRSAGASSANKWFYETWDPTAETWNADRANEIAPVLYCSFPSLKNPRHEPGPDQLHTGEVVTFIPYEMFARWREARWRKRGDEYEALKHGIEERLYAQFLRHMPGLAKHVVFRELSTPVSTEHFARAPGGAIYGLEPTPDRYANRWLRPRTPIRKLFLSGADMASVGVMGAFAGGVLAAASMEPVRTLRWLRTALRS